MSLQLLLGTAAIAFYDLEFDNAPCRLVVVANDHSPIPTAVIFAARHHGIGTVYRQHAPVAPEFLPLPVDLALLYDAVSCDIYRQAAHNHPALEYPKNKMVVLSPYRESGRPIDPGAPIKTVGISLPLSWDAAALAKLVNQMKKVAGVEGIVLRRHPASHQSVDGLLDPPRIIAGTPGQSAEAFASAIDLAVIPNSGIGMELLHFGVPTLYRDGLDTLGYDAYGFLAAGVLPDWTHRDLSELDRFGDFFDAQWRQRFARFDATQTSTPEAMRWDAKQAIEVLMAPPA
ncbi:hypothetical protein [Brevundimonas poindexterae]|uniref:hypothetical protein n=1 Tax=Brevundimonas poindexterae TaxID=74325 RepID=UPI001CFE8BC8|nr:hypothetical protein [Brevundimonas poindexterae]